MPDDAKPAPAPADVSLDELLSLLGVLRYGVPTEKKEAMALSRSLPGAPAVVGSDAPEAQRFASGFLHGKTWPQASQHTVPAAMFLRALLLNESPELQSFAQQGANIGRAR